MPMPAFLTWLGSLLAGYGVTTTLDELATMSADEKTSLILGELYELRQQFAALLGSASYTSCLASWDLRAAITDEEVGLNALAIHITNKHQDTDTLVQEAVDAVTDVNWGNQNLWNLIIAALGMIGEDPPPPPVLATNTDTKRILAAIYYTNWLWYNNPPPIDDAAILAAITAAQNAVNGHTDTELAVVETSVNNNTDADGDVTRDAIAALNNIPSSIVTDAVNAAVGTLTGEVEENVQLVLAALEALPLGEGSDPRFPGLAAVTLSSPVPVSGPAEITVAMDGCLVTINSVPSGTGKHSAGDYDSFLHGGWLAFIGPDGYGDELQYLNLNTAAYCPKRVKTGAGLVILPRAGMSVTVTPYTLA